MIDSSERVRRLRGNGSAIGALLGIVAAGLILRENRASFDPIAHPGSALLLLGLLAGVGAIAGRAGGPTGRAFFARRGWSAEDGTRVGAILIAGLLAFPAWIAGASSVLLAAAFPLRRRAAPRRSRLDSLALVLVVGGAAVLAARKDAPRLASVWTQKPAAGTPAAGSVPVTITVHSRDGFPEVPAVHPRIVRLASASPGKLAALYSGVAPERTPAGTLVPRRVPGGAVITSVPPLPIAFLFSRCVGRAIPDDDPALAARPLEEFAMAAGIPVLRAAPDSTDPPLWLRILVAPSPPDRKTAEAIARAGAWIDVHLADSESIALAGRGIRVAPIEASISLLDVAPTALHLLGLAVPRTCDGRVIAEALDPSQITARAPRYRS